MTKAQSVAARLRWALLAAGLLCWLAGLFYLFNVVWPQWKILPARDAESGAGLLGVLGYWTEETPYALGAALYAGLFLVTQWFFLRPRGGLRMQLNQARRPGAAALLIAGLMAALLTVGLLATVLHLAGAWTRFAYPDVNDALKHPRYWPALLVLAASWTLWAGVFFYYRRQTEHLTWVGRILRGLIAGSVLELLVAAPAQFLVKHEDECYCTRGSYTGLVLGGTVLLWCFGPGVAFLFLREKQRRQ